jgi:TetR/AcrR family transcriptional regulator, acrAB operon repressor
MARKTKEDTEATREGILDAAEACFLSEGVFRTTLEHIASRAGYTRGAVYWHFKNKLEVLEAVMDRVTLPVFSRLNDMASAATDQPLLQLREFYKSAFDEFACSSHARNAMEITMLRCEYAEETKPIYARHQRNTSIAVARITEALQSARRLNQLRAGADPAQCALTIHFVFVGALRDWLLKPDTISLQRDGMAALDIVLAGMAAEGALQTAAPRAQ